MHGNKQERGMSAPTEMSGPTGMSAPTEMSPSGDLELETDILARAGRQPMPVELTLVTKARRPGQDGQAATGRYSTLMVIDLDVRVSR